MYFENPLVTVAVQVYLGVCIFIWVSYGQTINYESNFNHYQEHMNMYTREDNSFCKRPEDDNFSNTTDFAMTAGAKIDISSLFFTEEEHGEIFEKEEPTTTRLLASDGGRCCQTTRFNKPVTYLKDIRRRWRKLAVLDHKYQYIPHVECRNVGCSGKCKPERVTIQLLVNKEENSSCDFEFASFPVYMYCSCKNIMTNSKPPLQPNVC